MEMNNLEKLLFYRPEKCSECGGKLEYLGIGRYRCMDCGCEACDDYGKVKEYFRTHGSATILQIVRATGVSKEKVNILLKRGMMELAPSSSFTLACELCGAGAGYEGYGSQYANSYFGNYSRNR